MFANAKSNSRQGARWPRPLRFHTNVLSYTAHRHPGYEVSPHNPACKQMPGSLYKKLAGKINQVMTASLKNGPALKNFKLQTIYVLAYNP